MTEVRKPLIAANWKMYKGPRETRDFVGRFAGLYPPRTDRTIVFFPPAISIPAFLDATVGRPDLQVGVQDVHADLEGAHTGAISAPMAAETGVGWGLAGHSDADVLIHAIIDALLGAAASGDIGRLFPDSDPLFAGISSLVLLGRTRACLAEKGARIVNVDAVVMAQQPTLAPYMAAMTATVAETLGVDVGCISIKATTTEHLGFVGREEGIAAQAVALVSL